MAVGTIIVGVGLLVPPKLGQGDLWRAIAVTAAVGAIAVMVSISGWLIDWATTIRA